MKKCATELMKELKAISTEIADLHAKDYNLSYNYAAKKDLYNYDNVREELEKQYALERKTRALLHKFNETTLVDGYDFNVEEGLVRLAQLRLEISVLSKLADRDVGKNGYSYSDRESILTMVPLYDTAKARADLKKKQHELSMLQIAIDRTNLCSFIDC